MTFLRMFKQSLSTFNIPGSCLTFQKNTLTFITNNETFRCKYELFQGTLQNEQKQSSVTAISETAVSELSLFILITSSTLRCVSLLD